MSPCLHVSGFFSGDSRQKQCDLCTTIEALPLRLPRTHLEAVFTRNRYTKKRNATQVFGIVVGYLLIMRLNMSSCFSGELVGTHKGHVHIQWNAQKTCAHSVPTCPAHGCLVLRLLTFSASFVMNKERISEFGLHEEISRRIVNETLYPSEFSLIVLRRPESGFFKVAPFVPYCCM